MMAKNKKMKMDKRQEKKDVYSRLCFLFEAGYTLTYTCPSNVSLICSYGRMITMLAQKNQCKLYPYIKRQICKCCHLILHPGVTSTVTLKSDPKRRVVTCKLCHSKRSYPTQSDNTLFIDAAITRMKELEKPAANIRDPPEKSDGQIMEKAEAS